MNNLHTLLTSDISRTKKIQEIAQMTKPYLLAQELLRYYEDSEHLREGSVTLGNRERCFESNSWCERVTLLQNQNKGE